MKYSVACICGYETPLVDNEEDIDVELLEIHQEFCEAYIPSDEKPDVEDIHPDTGRGKQ